MTVRAEQAIARYGDLNTAVERSGLPAQELHYAWYDMQAANADPPPAGGRKLAECGTIGAHRRHLRYREPVDPACRQAYVDWYAKTKLT